jgi:DNA-binding IclR family transcriptional regulator
MSRGIQAVERALAVVEFLAGGEILEWKTLDEVAQGAMVPMSSCHRILATLVDKGWVEHGPKGWRQGTGGLLKHGEYAKKYLQKLGEKINA